MKFFHPGYNDSVPHCWAGDMCACSCPEITDDPLISGPSCPLQSTRSSVVGPGRCSFPFTWNGEEFEACLTTIGKNWGNSYCPPQAVRGNYASHRVWRKCDDKCGKVLRIVYICSPCKEKELFSHSPSSSPDYNISLSRLMWAISQHAKVNNSTMRCLSATNYKQCSIVGAFGYCVFPYTYEDITYNGCANLSDAQEGAYCPTKVDQNGIAEWKDMRKCKPGEESCKITGS